MVFYYDKWYRLYGMRLSQHLISPPIQDFNNIEFPKNSIVHFAMLDKDPVYPTRKVNPFKKAPDDTIVQTIVEYPNEEECVGKFTRASITINEIIRNSANVEKEFLFLKNGQVLNKGLNTLYVHHYGCLNTRYRYMANMMQRYYIYQNGINTVISHLKDRSERNVFLILPMPKTLPSRVHLNRYAEQLKTVYLDKLPTYKHFNLLEIWKLLTPELRDQSVFNKIDIEKSKNINLILTIDNKYLCITLYRLLALVKEYELESDLVKYKHDLVKKAFYLALYSMGQTISMNELKSIQLKILKDGSGSKTKREQMLKDLDEVDFENHMDSMLEDEVVDVPDDIEEGELKTLERKKDEIATDLEDLLIADDEGIGETLINLDKSLSVSESDMNSLDEIYMNNIKYDGVEGKIDALLENKLITKKQHNEMIELLDNQKIERNLYADGEELGVILDDTKDDYQIDPKLSKIKDTPMVLDKTSNSNTIQTIQKEYIRKQYKKDLVRVFYSLQNSSTIVTNHRVELKESITGKLEEHVLDLKTLNGNNTTLKIILPHIEEDGTFEYSKSRYRLRTQRTDIPIRKIAKDKVELSSAYSKIFITRGNYAASNKSRYLLTNLSKRQGDDIDGLITGENKFMDIELPSDYTAFGNLIKSFKYKDYIFNFDYTKRYVVLKGKTEEDLIKLDKKFKSDDVVIIGKHKNDILVLDSLNRVFIYKDGKYIEQSDLYSILEINLNDIPLEYTTIKIMRSILPLGVILSYYLGLSNLLAILDIDFEEYEPKQRVMTDKDSFVIKFKDKKIKIKRDHGPADLILGGLESINKVSSEISSLAFEDRSMFNIIFSRLEVNLNTLNEIKLLETMFVDPMTLTVLKEMKEPITFKGLLFRANEMLTNDYYQNPNDIRGSVLKGYERISGIVYKEMINALRDHENRTHFTRSKITMAPHQVLARIQEDSSVVALDNLNPIAMIKQAEDTTQLGQGGRTKITMSKDTRNMDSSEIGIISEATKDSGDVGITAILSANPKINSLRGSIGSLNLKEDGWSSIMSTSAMLAPFGLSDDTKRLNFSSIMNSHIIPIKNMRAPYVLTGYEAIIPLKSSAKFAISAEDEGKVISVNDKEMVVKYKNLGEKKYNFSPWTTKEESGTCYTHYLVPNFKANDAFNKDDTLVYNKSFFEPCVFYPNRVIYKQGELITVALMENLETHEDSGSISYKLNDKLSTTVTKVSSTIVDVQDNIGDALNIGDEVNPSSVLFIVYNQFIESKDMDKETLDILKSLNKYGPKAKVKGKISKIEVYYNAELEDMSSTIKNFVNKIDKVMKTNYDYKGKVDNGYSVKGKALRKGQVEIKYYIESYDDMGIGDKAILGNQMKFTVGEVFNNEITGVDGTDIEMLFSSRSIAARIVNSPFLIGTTSMVLEKLTEKALKLYFGEK